MACLRDDQFDEGRGGGRSRTSAAVAAIPSADDRFFRETAPVGPPAFFAAPPNIFAKATSFMMHAVELTAVVPARARPGAPAEAKAVPVDFCGAGTRVPFPS